MDSQFQQSLTFVIIIFLVGFVLGMGAARLFFDSSSSPAAVIIDDEYDARVSGDALQKNAVDVAGQRAGDSVFVSLATLARSAWIAVHEDQGGKPGNILGARYFPAGRTAGTVELLRGTSPGNVYYAIIHGDDGDREFDFRNDAPLQDSFGNIIMDTFMTFESASTEQEAGEYQEDGISGDETEE